MFTVPSSTASSPNFRTRIRTAVVASADLSFRQHLTHVLSDLRWQVREVQGGAEAWSETQASLPEAVIIDSWLPDLELSEFLKDFREAFPQVDLVTAGAEPDSDSPRGPHRQELLYALQRCQDTDTAAWNCAPVEVQKRSLGEQKPVLALPAAVTGNTEPVAASAAAQVSPANHDAREQLPELIGNAPCMLEISRRVRLVAPRQTPVLIEGPTGSGKEIVAHALHRLSARNRKPFIAINCAAIPEALLEAELFGHTRGAFTGAVKGRVGRIEAADGGTLFLDEIGEMPLDLQSKLLRFVECGELQRVGDNETAKVDVRIIAATHRPLAQQAANGAFRSDLYYRLAVFLIRTPALAEHCEDLPLLVEHFLKELGREAPVKRTGPAALSKLSAHHWPGNVRELEHVLERAVILAADAPVLTEQDIDFGISVN